MIALILARGGSKGVPRKNLKELCGKPLLWYPINAAIKTKLISDIFVSTDDNEIADIAKSYGAKVIERPPELSKDASLDIDAFSHFCYETNYNEPIVHLRATTPILDPKTIDEAVLKYKENKDRFTSLRSAHETSESALKFYLKGNDYWEPLMNSLTEKPRQKCPKTYAPNGYVDIVNPKVFMDGNDFYGDKIYPFITKFTPEIDTMEDFEYIKFLMNKDV